MMKGRFIKTGVLVTAFLLIMGFGAAPRAQAASVIFDWENGVLDAGARTFTFDIVVGDITGLENLFGWQLDFDITRLGSEDTFSFNFIDITDDPNFVFYNDSFDYQILVNPGPSDPNSDNYNFFGSDLTNSGNGVLDPGGMLLARIVLDDVEFCNWFRITLNSEFSFFFDTGSGLENLGGTYDIHVVPIPGAVWLLGTGLLCLIGIRRRREG